MPVMIHPDLPGQPITVRERAVAEWLKSGWLIDEPEPVATQPVEPVEAEPDVSPDADPDHGAAE